MDGLQVTPTVLTPRRRSADDRAVPGRKHDAHRSSVVGSLLVVGTLSALLLTGCGDSSSSTDAAAPDLSGGGHSDGGAPPDLAGDLGMPPVGDSVLMHHHHPNRDGVYTQPTFTKKAIPGLKVDPNFHASLPDPKDNVYAQPLFVDGQGTGRDLVIVATEADNVYGLDAATGAIVWQKSLGKPVPLSSMPCGNIDPYGVTGTPVIDYAARTLYLSALVTPDGQGTTKQQLAFALSIDDGTIRTGWPVDVGAKASSNGLSFDVAHTGQRGALLLQSGYVYIPYGGLYGDCQPYHGWVVAISQGDPTKVLAWATPAAGGGSWMPGGVASDGTSLFISTGNTAGANNWSGGDAVIQLASGDTFGAITAYFAPSNWKMLDNTDLDLGTAPVVFDLFGSTPSALVLAFGKDGNAYLLDRGNLGGVGRALSATANNDYTLHVASDEIISAPVVYTTPTATYVAFKGAGSICTSGAGDLAALKIVPGTPPTLAASFCAQGGAGSPMVTTSDGHNDAIVWTLGAEANNRLNAFDGDSGAAINFTGHSVNIPNMRRYNAAIAAKGRIFVPADRAVVAFTL
jgi:hypothetical protein